MNIIKDIDYAGDESKQHLGNMLIPDGDCSHPIALCIHGGGWNSLDRSSFSGVAEFLCSQGFATFNIEYRLLKHAPWPGCINDCLLAARFLLDGGDEIPNLDRSQILVIGGSAGGHLALMTGLRLPQEKVSGIISISGICDLELDTPDMRFHLCPESFWGHEPVQDEIEAASPICLIKPIQPPVLCTHCTIDNVVSVEHSRNFIARCRDVGAVAKLFEYMRPLDGHCIWIKGSNPHKLFPEIEDAIIKFIYSRIKHS